MELHWLSIVCVCAIASADLLEKVSNYGEDGLKQRLENELTVCVDNFYHNTIELAQEIRPGSGREGLTAVCPLKDEFNYCIQTSISTLCDHRRVTEYVNMFIGRLLGPQVATLCH